MLDIKFMTSPDLAEVTGFVSIHLVNLSTITSRYFFFLAPFKWSDHVQPPDRKRPCAWYCPKSRGEHVTLICKELASNTLLDKHVGVCTNGGPKEPGSKGLAD